MPYATTQTHLMQAGTVHDIDGRDWVAQSGGGDGVRPLIASRSRGGERGHLGRLPGGTVWLAAMPDGITSAKARHHALRDGELGEIGAANVWVFSETSGLWRPCPSWHVPAGARRERQLLTMLTRPRNAGRPVCNGEIAREVGYRFSEYVRRLRARGYPIVTVRCPHPSSWHRAVAWATQLSREGASL